MSLNGIGLRFVQIRVAAQQQQYNRNRHVVALFVISPSLSHQLIPSAVHAMRWENLIESIFLVRFGCGKRWNGANRILLVLFLFLVLEWMSAPPRRALRRYEQCVCPYQWQTLRQFELLHAVFHRTPCPFPFCFTQSPKAFISIRYFCFFVVFLHSTVRSSDHLSEWMRSRKNTTTSTATTQIGNFSF